MHPQPGWGLRRACMIYVWVHQLFFIYVWVHLGTPRTPLCVTEFHICHELYMTRHKHRRVMPYLLVMVLSLIHHGPLCVSQNSIFVTNCICHVTRGDGLHARRSPRSDSSRTASFPSRPWLFSSPPRPGLIHMCDVTHLYVRQDSFICATWLIHMCDMTHSYVRHDSCICATWLTRLCDMTRL